MDKQQLFLASNIFDIDSALDRLEENLLTSNVERSAISTEPISQQQKFDITRQQQNKDYEEENGNSLSDCGVSESNNDNKSEFAKCFAILFFNQSFF